MKASGVDSEVFEFPRRVFATNTQFLLIAVAFLLLSARATAAQAPTVTIDQASQVTGVSAIIGGTVNANGLATWCHFQWGTTTSHDHSGDYFLLAPLDIPLTFSNLLTGLSTNTTYHYQLVATNSAGTTSSPDMTFTTTAAEISVPVVTINPATDVTAFSATITGSVNPNGAPAQVYVQSGYTTAYGTNLSVGTVPAQNAPVPVSATLSFLTPNTTYHCRLAAYNTDNGVFSADISFTTPGAPPPPPLVTINAASDVSTNSAKITGWVTPNGLPTQVYVQWGTTVAYGASALVSMLPGDNVTVLVSTTLTGLATSTIYHCRLQASNTVGSAFSSDISFGTPAGPLEITGITDGADQVTGTSALLKGRVALNWPSEDAAGYFRWGLTTAYGNTTPLRSWGGNWVGEQADWEQLYGLSPGTTYHFQMVATNSWGVSEGADMTFTTLSSITIDGQVFTYTVTNGTVTIFSYNGPGGAVTIPDTINGLPVTTIGPAAFDASAVTNITIPNSVTTIGYNAFNGCYSLAGVTIPNSVTNIGAGAFEYCPSLASVTIPGSVTNLGAQAFAFCNGLTNLTIGNGVITLGSMAFMGCGLTSVVIPDSVVTIEDGAPIHISGVPGGLFAYCSALTNVSVGKGLTYLGYAAFFSCPNLVSVFFHGNAPTPGQGWFGQSGPLLTNDPATVYYLPGTTGWDSTFDGRPTKLWNPLLQDYSFGSGPDQGCFEFTIRGTPDIPLLIETSTDPLAATWTPLQTCVLTNGLFEFTDSGSINYPVRFYRIRPP
jgi:hypothetical protein